MKQLLFLTIALICSINLSLSAREVKVSVTPSDAKIYVDGNYYADGVATVNVSKKYEFVVIKLESPGYVTMETKIYASDKRKAISYTLRRDGFFDVSVASGLVNKYFNVKVSKDLYHIDENGNNKWDAGNLEKKIQPEMVYYYPKRLQLRANWDMEETWPYKNIEILKQRPAELVQKDKNAK